MITPDTLPARPAPAPPERDFRGPGCDEACTVIRALIPGVFGRSEILVHAPSAHEDYGRYLATLGEVRVASGQTILTGPLAIDLQRVAVAVDGRPIHLTPSELRLMIALARRIGCSLAYVDLYAAMYGNEISADAVARPVFLHTLRVNLARLRAKLGAEGGRLITTVVAYGLRLEIAEPTVAVPSDWRVPVSPKPWAKHFEACTVCASTAHGHAAHGICRACRNAARQLERG